MTCSSASFETCIDDLPSIKVTIKNFDVEFGCTLRHDIWAAVVILDTVFRAPTLNASALQTTTVFASTDTELFIIRTAVLEEGAVVIASTGKSARPYIRQQPKELQYTRVLAKS